ncbi:MAG TPA: hypothetical protein VE133_11175 [Candidatus Sulfotelmatobacter sp.]|nr:hypothetical protein [Candidatus Sulfotelmatobacter sp.]
MKELLGIANRKARPLPGQQNELTERVGNNHEKNSSLIDIYGDSLRQRSFSPPAANRHSRGSCLRQLLRKNRRLPEAVLLLFQ